MAALVALGATAAGAEAIVRVIPAPLKTCPNPKAPAGAKPEKGGLDPGQLAAAYGITSLWARGFKGQGRSVALIEPGTALGPNPGKLSACYGPYPKIHQALIKGTAPKPGGEGNLDPVGVLSLAPRARVYLIESGTKGATGESTAKLIRAALNPHRTGGHLVDAISMSFGTCEAALSVAKRRGRGIGPAARGQPWCRGVHLRGRRRLGLVIHRPWQDDVHQASPRRPPRSVPARTEAGSVAAGELPGGDVGRRNRARHRRRAPRQRCARREDHRRVRVEHAQGQVDSARPAAVAPATSTRSPTRRGRSGSASRPHSPRRNRTSPRLPATRSPRSAAPARASPRR